MSETSSNVAIGIDVGGTAIKAGLVTEGGEVLAKLSVPTEVNEGVEHVIGCLVDVIGQLRSTAVSQSLAVCAVGLGMPGTLSHRRGVVIAPPNLPGWRNVPIVERLESRMDLSVVLDNDANNAAFGEYVCGAGQGVLDMVMLTLGTGIGGGLIFNGKLWRGERENAGELGHMIVHVGGRQCRCGQLGCLEAYSSGGATVARVVDAIEKGEPSCLKDVLDRGEAITVEKIIDAAFGHDKVAERVWMESCRYLAVGCLNIQHALSPGRIVLAGGISGAGSRLHSPVVEALEDLSSRSLGERPDIQIAVLGNDAGFIGSAMSVFQEV